LEIQVTRMRDLLDLFKPVVPKKSSIKSTAYICFREGKAMATDLETMITASCPEATGQEPLLLPFASLSEMLKYVPGTEMLQIAIDNKMAKLTWHDGNASYPVEDPKDFPIPSPDLKASAEGDLDGDTLVPAMLAALPYTATETTRPVLNGISLTLGNPVEVDAADGFRLAHQVLGLSFPVEEKVVIPAKAVSIIGHIFAKTPREPSASDSLIKAITARRSLHVGLIDGKIKVDFGKAYSVLARLAEGTFPNILQLLPKGEPILQSQVFAPQFEAAVRRLKGVAKDGKGIIRLDFANDTIKLSATGDDQEVSATLNTINSQGGPHSVGLDVKYLLEYFSKKEGIVIISRYDDSGPVSFQYQKSPRVLVMPMLLGEPPKPAEQEKTEPEAEASLEEKADETDQTSAAEEEAAEAEQEAGENEPETVTP